MACCAVSDVSSSIGVWPVLCSGGDCIGGGGGGGWASHGGVGDVGVVGVSRGMGLCLVVGGGWSSGGDRGESCGGVRLTQMGGASGGWVVGVVGRFVGGDGGCVGVFWCREVDGGWGVFGIG